MISSDNITQENKSTREQLLLSIFVLTPNYINKNAYYHYTMPEVLLTDLLHISFPAKSREISFLIHLNSTPVSLKPQVTQDCP